MRRFALLSFGLATAGCSLVGLDDQIKIETCDANSDCVHLEALYPTPDCEQWVCDSVTAECIVGPEDADDDGSPRAACLPAGDPNGDCDDADGTNAPNGTELCDAKDNDCDSNVDEVTFVTTATPTQLARSTTDIAVPNFAYEPTSRATFATYIDTDLGTTGPSKLTAQGGLAAGAALQGPAGALAPRALAFDSHGQSDLVAAVLPGGVCQRVSIGLLRGAVASTATSITVNFGSVSGTHFQEGLPDASAALCPASGGTLLARSPSVASDGQFIVASWVAQDAISQVCQTVASAPALVNFATLNAAALNTTPIVPSTAAALAIGDTDDPAPPAILATEPRLFFTAVAEGGGVHLRRVRASTAGGNAIAVDVLYDSTSLVNGVTRVGDFALAAGPLANDHIRLALAFRGGICSMARAYVALFDYDNLAGTIVGNAPVSVQEITTQQYAVAMQPSLSIVYSAQPLGFWVAWPEQLTRVLIRGISGDGTLLGTPATVLDKFDASNTNLTVAGRPFLSSGLSPTDSTGLTLLVPGRAMGSSAQSAILAKPLVCPTAN